MEGHLCTRTGMICRNSSCFINNNCVDLMAHDAERREDNVRLKGELERVKAENEKLKEYNKDLEGAIDDNGVSHQRKLFTLSKEIDKLKSERDEFAIGFRNWAYYQNRNLGIEDIEKYRATLK